MATDMCANGDCDDDDDDDGYGVMVVSFHTFDARRVPCPVAEATGGRARRTTQGTCKDQNQPKH